MDSEQWMNHGQSLKEELLEYDWQYRAKICVKCPLSEQERRKCLRVNNYKVIKGVKIQETHCDWLVNARTNKFRSRINGFLNLGMNRMFGTKLPDRSKDD